MRPNPTAKPLGAGFPLPRPAAPGLFRQWPGLWPAFAHHAALGGRPVLAGLHALVLLAVLAGPAQAAGIDCTKAKTPVERMLCADPALRAADGAVADAFAAALAAAPDQGAVRACQRQWLAARNACPDAACLLARHTEQRQALAALAAQPAQTTPPGSERKSLLAERAALKARLNWPADCEASFQETYSPEGTGLELLTNGVDHYDLGQGRTLYLIQCDQAAYQSVFVAMATEAGGGPARLLRFPTADADGGRITRSLEDSLVGNPVFDPAAKTLTNLTKARGVGDCGTYAVYAFAASGDPRPLELRARDCPKNGGKYLPPERWPLVTKP